jgi:hypothetical protein
MDDWEEKREQILNEIVPRIMRGEKIDDLDFWGP